MSEAQQRVLVKRGSRRSLWCEARGNPAGKRAVKCFHDSGLLGRALDRRRAVRERDALLALRALGFRVPAPYGIETTAEGVELSLEWIEDAVTLFDLVRGAARLPAPPERIARALGAQLGLVRRHGVRFADLHAKNVLVDGGGGVWLVDVAGVEIGGARDDADSIVALLAELREHVPLRLRLRAAVACERGLGGRVDRPRLEGWNERARTRRRDVALRSVRRWTRESSVTVPIARGELRGWRSRLIDEADAWRLLDAGGAASVAGNQHDVLAAWRNTARLAEHALPCAAPLALHFGAPGTDARAVFEDHGARTPLDPAARRRAAVELGRLLGLLHDRGLALASPIAESVAIDVDGAARFTHRARTTAAGADVTAAARVLAAGATKRERALFVIAFANAVGDTLAARTALRTAWRNAATTPREPWRRRARTLALDGATSAASVIPHPLVRGALTGLAPLARATRYERQTRSNLELVFGADHAADELRRIANGVRAHAARQFSEWLRLAGSGTPESARWIDELVELDPSVSILEREVARRGGALVVTAHIGNWELLAARLRRAGHAGAVVGYRRPRDGSSRWLERMRERYGVRNIPQSAHPREILRVLEDGGVVGLLADLEVRRLDGEFLPFLGHEALTMTAPAALARATRRPLLPARCVLDRARGRYVLSFEPPLEPDPALDRRARTRDLSLRLNAVFERWIREHPEQWAWHQPRWRTRPDPGIMEAAPVRRPRRTALERPRTGASLPGVDRALSAD